MADRLKAKILLLLLIVASLTQVAPGQVALVQAALARPDWVQGRIATLQGLDKITARISTLTIEVGSPQRFGALMITLHACTFKPPDEPPEHAALMSVHHVDHEGGISAEPVFQGWMFASSPAVSALEHPVYDISVLACE